MKKGLYVAIAALLCGTLACGAVAQWQDGFESYSPGVLSVVSGGVWNPESNALVTSGSGYLGTQGVVKNPAGNEYHNFHAYRPSGDTRITVLEGRLFAASDTGNDTEASLGALSAPLYAAGDAWFGGSGPDSAWFKAYYGWGWNRVLFGSSDHLDDSNPSSGQNGYQIEVPMDPDNWYDVKMVLDYGAGIGTGYYRLSGSPTWLLMEGEGTHYDPTWTATSLGTINTVPLPLLDDQAGVYNDLGTVGLAGRKNMGIDDVSTSYGVDPVFEDVTDTVGLSGLPPATYRGTGAAWGDYNNDGWPDLYIVDTLWRNNNGASFTKVTTSAPDQHGGIWGDYNNDGFLDLYAWYDHVLYRNVGGTGFVNESSNLPDRPSTCKGASWGDLNGDGFIDLYVGGFEPGPDQDSILLNNGSGAFTMPWQSGGWPARGIAQADFDEDGDLDTYVSNYRLVQNVLWRNDGSIPFTDVAVDYGVAGDGDQGAWGHTIGSAWGDLDNDGHLDLFVGNFAHEPDYQDRPKFLKNLGPAGAFHFQDMSATAGLAYQETFASPVLGDFDNDGYLDLYYTTAQGYDEDPVLYRNNGDWTFTNVTGLAGLGGLNSTYAAAWADYDGDGDLDLITDEKLFRNVGNANHWLKIRLEGPDGVNRAAIGAQVRVDLGAQTLTRQVEGATGQGSQNDLTLHFGLGENSGPVHVTISWPGGAEREFDTAVDRLLVISRTTVVDKLQEAKILPDGTAIETSGMIATTDASDYAGIFYIEEPDRTSGIRVVPSSINGTLAKGKTVEVYGTLATTGPGERYLDDATVTVTGTPSLLDPIGMTNLALGGGDYGTSPNYQMGVTGGTGPNNIGLLVRVWGEATVSGITTIDDGSGVALRVITSALTTPPTNGEYVTLTGISSIAPGGSRLLFAID